MMVVDSGLRDKITKTIEGAYLRDTGKGVGFACLAAADILAIPEIRDAQERIRELEQDVEAMDWDMKLMDRDN